MKNCAAYWKLSAEPLRISALLRLALESEDNLVLSSVGVPFGLMTVFHPIHGPITFLAKISPKPNMTPLTNGRNILMANDERSASARVLAGTTEENIRGVTAGGCCFGLAEGTGGWSSAPCLWRCLAVGTSGSRGWASCP